MRLAAFAWLACFALAGCGGGTAPSADPVTSSPARMSLADPTGFTFPAVSTPECIREAVGLGLDSSVAFTTCNSYTPESMSVLLTCVLRNSGQDDPPQDALTNCFYSTNLEDSPTPTP